MSQSKAWILLLGLTAVAFGIDVASADRMSTEDAGSSTESVTSTESPDSSSSRPSSPRPSSPRPSSPRPTPPAASPHIDCPDRQGWMAFNGKCYKQLESAQYWYDAEQMCRRRYGGHLVSINSRQENTFVSKLTFCRAVWTGGFAVSVDRLTDASNYRWTDASVSTDSYFPHDNSSISHIHMPLLRVEGLRLKNSVYHARQTPVCEVPSRPGNHSNGCQQGWKQLRGFCYRVSSFTTGYTEGLHYCRQRSATLVSVHDIHELNAVSLLDLDTHECAAEFWIGLSKLHECRIDIRTGRKICFQWYDGSGDFKDFPKWSPGHPKKDYKYSCVSLTADRMKTVPCYMRNRFVCKKPAAQVSV